MARLSGREETQKQVFAENAASFETMWESLERIVRLNLNSLTSAGSWYALTMEGLAAPHVEPWVVPGGETRDSAPVPRIARLLLRTDDGAPDSARRAHLMQAAMWPSDESCVARGEIPWMQGVLRRMLSVGLFGESVGCPYQSERLNEWIEWLLKPWGCVVDELDDVRQKDAQRAETAGLPRARWVLEENFLPVNGTLNFAACGGANWKKMRAQGAGWLWAEHAPAHMRYWHPRAMREVPRPIALFMLAHTRQAAYARLADIALSGVSLDGDVAKAAIAQCEQRYGASGFASAMFGPLYVTTQDTSPARSHITAGTRGMFKLCGGITPAWERMRKWLESSALAHYDAIVPYMAHAANELATCDDNAEIAQEWEPDARWAFHAGALPAFRPLVIVTCALLSGCGFDNRQSTSVNAVAQSAGPTNVCTVLRASAVARAAVRAASRTMFDKLRTIVHRSYKSTGTRAGARRKRRAVPSKQSTKIEQLLDAFLKAGPQRCRKRQFPEAVERMIRSNATERAIIAEAVAANLLGLYELTAKPLHGQLRAWVITHLLLPDSSPGVAPWTARQLRRWMTAPGVILYVRQSLNEVIRYSVSRYPALCQLERITRVGKNYDYYCTWANDACREAAVALTGGHASPLVQPLWLHDFASVRDTLDTYKLHSGDTVEPDDKSFFEFVYNLSTVWKNAEHGHAVAVMTVEMTEDAHLRRRMRDEVEICLCKSNAHDLPAEEAARARMLFPWPDEAGWGPAAPDTTFFDRLVLCEPPAEVLRRIEACVDVLIPTLTKSSFIYPPWTWLVFFGMSAEAILLVLEAYSCFAHPRMSDANYLSLVVAAMRELGGEAPMLKSLRRLHRVAASRVGSVLVRQLAMRAYVEIQQCARAGVVPESKLQVGAGGGAIWDYAILRAVIQTMDGYGRYRRTPLPRFVAIAQERALRRAYSLPEVSPDEQTELHYRKLATEYVCPWCGRPKFHNHDVFIITKAEERRHALTVCEMHDGEVHCTPMQKKTTPIMRQLWYAATWTAVHSLPAVWQSTPATDAMRSALLRLCERGDMNIMNGYAENTYHGVRADRPRSIVGAAVLRVLMKTWYLHKTNRQVEAAMGGFMTPDFMEDALSTLRKLVNMNRLHIECSTRPLIATSLVGCALTTLDGTHYMCCVCSRIFLYRSEYVCGPLPLCAIHAEEARAYNSGVAQSLAGVEVARPQPNGGANPLPLAVKHAGEGFVVCMICGAVALPTVHGGSHTPLVVYVGRHTFWARLCERLYSITPNDATDFCYAAPSTTAGMSHGGRSGFVRRYLCPTHRSACWRHLQPGAYIPDAFELYVICQERKTGDLHHRISASEQIRRTTQHDNITAIARRSWARAVEKLQR